jgi:hypothetical protein
VLAQLLGSDRGARFEPDDGAHRLAPLLVGHADHVGVGDRGVELQRLLHLLGIHLLARGVDAHRASTEEPDRAVRVDGRPIPRHRPDAATEGAERSGGLVGILVVADRDRSPDGHEAVLRRPGLDLATVLGEDLRVLSELEPRG